MERITIIIEDESTIAAIEDFRKRCHIENLDYFIISACQTYTESYLKDLGKLRLPDDSKILPESEEQYLSFALSDANNLLQFAQSDYDYYKNELEKYREKRVKKYCIENNINEETLLNNAVDEYIINHKKD